MLVRNVEPRLIRVGGEFIAPNQTMEINEHAVGLADLIERGVLIRLDEPKAKGKKQEP